MLKDLVKRVKEYNTLLRYMGLKDHQVGFEHFFVEMISHEFGRLNESLDRCGDRYYSSAIELDCLPLGERSRCLE